MTDEQWDLVWTVACSIALAALIAAVIYLAAQVQA